MSRFRSRRPSWPRNPFRTPPVPPPLPGDALQPAGNPLGGDNDSTLPGLPPPPGDGPPPAEEATPPNPMGGRRRVTLPRSTRVWSRAIVWSLIAITTGGTIYGLLARIESSVSAPGRLQPIGGAVELSPPLNGLVQKVFVKNGQQVNIGQPLLVLRDDAGPELLRNLERIQRLWIAEVQSLGRQLNLGPLPTEPEALTMLLADQRELELRERASDRELERAKLQLQQQMSDLQGIRAQLKINQNITARMRRLVDVGAMSKLDLDRQMERQQQLITTLRRTEGEWKSAQQRVEEIRLKRLQIPAAERRQIFTRFNNARQQLLEVTSKIADQEQRRDFQEVVSPIKGKIAELNAKPGEIVTPSKPVAKIIPNTPMEASLNVSNRDIGFLRKGMKVDIRIDSFPSTEYGSIKGWIKSISDDALAPDETTQTEHYKVTVKLNRQDIDRRGVTYGLRAGMGVSGLIVLDSRPAISVITDRFNRFFESSRTIR